MPLLSAFGGASVFGFKGMGKAYKTYTLISDQTIGTATTSVTFSGLNYNAGDELLLVATHITTSTYSNMSIYVNGNTTATNYYMQGLYITDTSIGANRLNTSAFYDAGGASGSYTSATIAKLKMTNNGFFTWQVDNSRFLGLNIFQTMKRNGTSLFTISSITSLTLASDNANQIGIGSRFQLYKINP